MPSRLMMSADCQASGIQIEFVDCAQPKLPQELEDKIRFALEDTLSQWSADHDEFVEDDESKPYTDREQPDLEQELDVDGEAQDVEMPPPEGELQQSPKEKRA